LTSTVQYHDGNTMVANRVGEGEPRMIVRSAFLVFVLVTSATGQETRGAIQGRVSDPSGASVAGAQVHATNSATGVEVSGDR